MLFLDTSKSLTIQGSLRGSSAFKSTDKRVSASMYLMPFIPSLNYLINFDFDWSDILIL